MGSGPRRRGGVSRGPRRVGPGGRGRRERCYSMMCDCVRVGDGHVPSFSGWLTFRTPRGGCCRAIGGRLASDRWPNVCQKPWRVTFSGDFRGRELLRHRAARNMPTSRRATKSMEVRACRPRRVWRRAACVKAELVIPRCEHVFVFTDSTVPAKRTRSSLRLLLELPPFEYGSSPIRVVHYARSDAGARRIIESVAFRSGTPEHRLDRNAASCCCPCRSRGRPRRTNRMKLSAGRTILTRVSAGHPIQRVVGRLAPHCITSNSSTPGESCPTQ